MRIVFYPTRRGGFASLPITVSSLDHRIQLLLGQLLALSLEHLSQLLSRNNSIAIQVKRLEDGINLALILLALQSTSHLLTTQSQALTCLEELGEADLAVLVLVGLGKEERSVVVVWVAGCIVERDEELGLGDEAVAVGVHGAELLLDVDDLGLGEGGAVALE